MVKQMETSLLKIRSLVVIILHFYLYMYLYSSILAQNFKRENQGVSFAKFIKAPSVKLNAFQLVHLKVSRLGECTFECINNKQCFSVNFGALRDGQHSCELLKMDMFRKSSSLAASKEFDHYYIKVSQRKIFKFTF